MIIENSKIGFDSYVSNNVYTLKLLGHKQHNQDKMGVLQLVDTRKVLIHKNMETYRYSLYCLKKYDLPHYKHLSLRC